MLTSVPIDLLFRWIPPLLENLPSVVRPRQGPMAEPFIVKLQFMCALVLFSIEPQSLERMLMLPSRQLIFLSASVDSPVHGRTNRLPLLPYAQLFPITVLKLPAPKLVPTALLLPTR